MSKFYIESDVDSSITEPATILIKNVCLEVKLAMVGWIILQFPV